MRNYQHRFTVKAPIDQVVAFHRDTKALKRLTPPPVYVSFKDVQPLAENSRADFTMWLGPIPLHWSALHSDVHPTNGFTDTQVKGPFESWVHRHIFERVGENSTAVVDEIQAQPGEHFFWGLVSRLMWTSLPLLFAYRARQTRRALEK